MSETILAIAMGGIPLALAVSLASQAKKNTDNFTVFEDDGLLSAINAFKTAHGAWTQAEQEAKQRNERLAEIERVASEERQLRILDVFPLRETAEARERLQVLLDHLNDPQNIDHYRFAVWNERGGAVDTVLTSLSLAGWIQPTPLGIVGNRLALAIRTDKHPLLASFLQNSIVDLVSGSPSQDVRHLLPTTALYTEAVVGDCCACENAIVRRDQEENRKLTLANDLSELEIRRLNERLNADPPLLEKEFPPPAQFDVNVRGGDARDHTPDQ